MPLGHGDAIVCRDAFLKEDQLNALLSRFSHVIDINVQEAPSCNQPAPPRP